MLKTYQSLKFKLTHIRPKEKRPEHSGWNVRPTKYKEIAKHIEAGFNIGLLHSFSRTCCFDIDDVKLAKKEPLLRKIMAGGLHYTSGKPNRLKVLYRIPKKYDILKFLSFKLTDDATGALICDVNCATKNGASMQDVLPPSRHPEGTTYEWVDKEITDLKVPPLPKDIRKEWMICAKAMSMSNRDRYKNEYVSHYVRVYNEWFTATGKRMHKPIVNSGHYEKVGLGKYKRVGSDNPHAIVIYDDLEGECGYNYSSTTGNGFLQQGAFDPYNLLVIYKFKGDEQAARKWVCNHKTMKPLVDAAASAAKSDLVVDIGIGKGETVGDYKSDESVKVELLNMKGILYDPKDQTPHVSIDLMHPTFDGNTNFAQIVKSVVYHQAGVYNPDMGFYIGMAVVDYLAGCGYQSVNSSRCNPLYIMLVGKSSDGKTSNIISATRHIDAVMGTDIDAKLIGDNYTDDAIHADVNNKFILPDIGSAQGLEDFITMNCSHGTDLLMMDDEAGLKLNEKMDKADKLMREKLLTLKTLDRSSFIEPRLLAAASTGTKKKVERNPVCCIHYTYVTTSSEETMKGVLGSAEVGQGYQQRFISGLCRSIYFKARARVFGSAYGDTKIEPAVLSILNDIHDTSNTVLGIDRVEGGVPVPLTDLAKEYLETLSVLCIESDDVNYRKIAENVLSVVRVPAICANPIKPVVTLAMMQWSHTIVSCSILQAIHLHGKLNASGLTNFAIEVKYKETMAGWGTTTPFTKSDIVRRCNFGRIGADAIKYNPVFEALVDSGYLIIQDKKDWFSKKRAEYMVDEGMLGTMSDPLVDENIGVE